MNKSRKIILLIVRGMGVILIAFLIFILVSPMLINLESAKEKIIFHLSAKTGGDLHYEKIDLYYFPRPHAVIYQPRFSMPGNISGTLANLKVYPAIFSLFTGDVRVSKLQLITPTFDIKLPISQKKKNAVISASFAREMLTRALTYPALNQSSFFIEVKSGRLNLYDENKVVFNFININANTRLLLNRLTIDLACQSNLWKNISMKGRIDPHLFTVKGQVDVTLFNPKVLIDYLFPDTGLKVSTAGINLILDFKSDKHHALHAKVKSHESHLAVLHQNENVAIQAKSLICKLNMDEEKTKVSLSNLVLDYPKLRASGQFLLNRMVNQTSLDIDVKKADVGSTRKVALALAGTNGITKDIFEVVKGGNIPEITFKTFGKSPADLGKLENIFLRGRLRDGNIFVPAALLDLKDVNGSVTLSNGILAGENIKVRLGNSVGTSGILELGFEKNIPFYVETFIQADLAQLPPILKRLVKNQPFLQELSQIKKVGGSALGKMVLDGNTESVDVGVYASQINLKARYGRIPYPLQIEGRRFAYKGRQISFDNLNAAIGTSSFSRLSGGITWKDEPQLKIESRSSILKMGEIYPWLLSGENIAAVFKDFKISQGIAALSAINISGPVLRPMNWHINMRGSLENIVINSPLSPDPILVTDGKLDVTESTIPGIVKNNFTLESSNLGWGNSRFTAEGSMIVSQEGLWIYTELSADKIGWVRVDQIVEYVNKRRDPGYDEKHWTLPVEGVFRIKSNVFTCGDLSFNPTYADIFLKNNKVFIDFTKANLCGISVPGSIKISSGNMELYLYPVAENQQLGQTVTCHWGKNQLVTGPFNLSGKLFAISDSKEIGKVLNGNLKFSAQDGRIYRYEILAKILALLNLSEIFRGKLPDVIEEGFAYESIRADGNLTNGKFVFEEFIIDGSSMAVVCKGYIDLVRDEMDLMVLVAPFKTVDFIIKKIPLVNHILGGKLVSIPFRVKGNPADPDIIPLSPTAIGAGIFGLLKRTFALPVVIMQPLFTDKEYKDTEPAMEQRGP